jgi:LuxR family maltose regulon positive regulatory protein
MSRRSHLAQVAPTKFAVPRGPRAMVVRPRLLDVLDEGVRGALTLVAAPAGAGKSALLASWIAGDRSPGPVGWLSLDADDADRRRFWRAVIETLRRATGDEAVAALEVSPREPLSTDLVLPGLVEALARRDEPVVLVLDDFHEVDEAVHEDLARLARFPPAALRLVIVTRADPTIGLGRLRLDGRLTEVRAAELAFSLDEARQLFEALGIELAPADVETLWRRTEGWAAALRMAALSVQRHPDPHAFIERFAGTDATISDYLVQEVLARQPPQLRAFLLRTSVVDTLSAELADALTGTSGGRVSLAQLERGGVLTTPLDEHGIWHRYHPLFAELLRAELRAQLPDELETLHCRAASWLAARGDYAAAMRHAAAGAAWDLAAEVIVDHWVQLLINGEMAALRPIVDAMPRERVDASPELALAFAGSFLARGDRASAQPFLAIAAKRASLVPVAHRAQFAATMAAVNLYEGRLRGDFDAALRAARRLLDGEVVLAPGRLSGVVRAFVMTQLGIVELWSGDLDAATRHLERGYATSVEEASEWTALAAASQLAMARLLRGDLARATRHADDAIGLAERHGWARSEPAGAAYTVQAAVLIMRGRREEAVALIDRAGHALHSTRDRPLRVAHALNRALLLRDDGEPAAALAVLQAARDELGDWPLPAALDDLLVAQEGLLRAAVGDREAGRAMLERVAPERARSVAVANALARLRLQDGDREAARLAVAPHLRTGDGSLADVVPLSGRAEAWLLDALAHAGLPAHEDAARSLERALDIAHPAGLMRLLTEHGSAVRPLLHRHLGRGTAHPAMLAAAIDALDRGGRDAPRPGATLLAVPLSEREQSILRYLPTMMSNREIAAELLVSVNTVKTHLKAIYRKLGAPSRRDAVDRAREFELIP